MPNDGNQIASIEELPTPVLHEGKPGTMDREPAKSSVSSLVQNFHPKLSLGPNCITIVTQGPKTKGVSAMTTARRSAQPLTQYVENFKQKDI